jgi:hypothetical protein
MVARRRFEYGKALRYAQESEQAGEDYVRFNPANGVGWELLGSARLNLADLLFDQGRIQESIAQLHAATALEQDSRNSTGIAGPNVLAWGSLASREEQLGQRAAAHEAADEFSRAAKSYLLQTRAGDEITRISDAGKDNLRYDLAVTEGKYDRAFSGASASLQQLEKIPEKAAPRFRDGAIRESRGIMVAAGLRLGRFADAEKQARLLLEKLPDEVRTDPADASARVQVSLAWAVAAQGRKPEARKILEPVLARYRDQKAQGARHVEFLQNFSRALYVEAITEADDPAGRLARRSALDEAAGLITELPGEAKALHDSRELAEWISAARAKVGE